MISERKGNTTMVFGVMTETVAAEAFAEIEVRTESQLTNPSLFNLLHRLMRFNDMERGIPFRVRNFPYVKK